MSRDLKMIKWNVCKTDTIGTRKKSLIYGDVQFIEIPLKSNYLAKI